MLRDTRQLLARGSRFFRACKHNWQASAATQDDPSQAPCHHGLADWALLQRDLIDQGQIRHFSLLLNLSQNL
jgi:hypothetical protein